MNKRDKSVGALTNHACLVEAAHRRELGRGRVRFRLECTQKPPLTLKQRCERSSGANHVVMSIFRERTAGAGTQMWKGPLVSPNQVLGRPRERQGRRRGKD